MADHEKLRMKAARELARRYRVERPKSFRIDDVDAGDTGGLADEEYAEKALEAGVELISDFQEKLYAQDHWSLLLVFQAMDAAGKDSTIAHVMSGVNPAGVQVFSFKAPTSEELDHDYLWRHAKCLPERGRIGIFNRSWYEEVLTVRVHPEILGSQRMPPKLVTKHVWDERFDDINAFERYLARNGVIVLKFFLHVSKEEQRKRFLARIEKPGKNWKFKLSDVEEREHWDEYMLAYEEMIRRTSTKQAPWYAVPADHKWFTRLVVSSAIVDTLEKLDVCFPDFDKGKLKELAEARRRLLREK